MSETASMKKTYGEKWLAAISAMFSRRIKAAALSAGAVPDETFINTYKSAYNAYKNNKIQYKERIITKDGENAQTTAAYASMAAQRRINTLPAGVISINTQTERGTPAQSAMGVTDAENGAAIIKKNVDDDKNRGFYAHSTTTSADILQQNGSCAQNGARVTQNISFNMSGTVVRERADIDELAERMVERLRRASLNMA